MSNDADVLDATDVFRLDAVRQQGDFFVLEGRIAHGYHVYRHALKLTDSQGREVSLELPAGTRKHDEFFGDTEIYTGAPVRLRFPAATPGPVTLHWQGCAQAGICYPPQTIKISLSAAGGNSSSLMENSATQSAPSFAAPETSKVATQEQTEARHPLALQVISPPEISPRANDILTVADTAEDQAAAQRLAALGPIFGTLLFFGFGLLLAFTPCTLPMIPIVSSIIVGSQARPRRALVLSLSYVLAMASTYAAVGVAAGLAGANLQAALQSPWLLGAFAALFLLLASSLFGLFELSLPSVLVNRVESVNHARSGGSVTGAAALGFLSALLVGPCMTAPLAGGLLYIGQTGSAFQGGLALFALGLGMGAPLLAIAVFGARVLPRPGAWMGRVRVLFGYVMAGMAVMMLSRFLPGTLSLVLWGAWILSLAVGLVAWAQAVAARQRLAWTLRFGAVFAGLWATLILVGAASGADSALQPLAHFQVASAVGVTASVPYVQVKSIEEVDTHLADAATREQWTLIDFYADWCVSCHAIERNVFGNSAVLARLANVRVVRPDVTHNDATDQALLKRWGVMGPPTLVFVGPDGRERRELRVVGEINAQEFLNRLDVAGVP